VKKKLIEVALPLEAISIACADEKSVPRRGHPATLHLWWARRPLAACRAILFGQLVDDPSAHPDQFPTAEAQDDERERLFRVMEELVRWENSHDTDVLARARAEVERSCGGSPPPVLDPFCGGGSIPLEAQRLGLAAYASDLNPVATLITRAVCEFPTEFADQSPVHPNEAESVLPVHGWVGTAGLVDDVRWYGQWMHEEAQRRIGDAYPVVDLPDGRQTTAVGWLWARTVVCPNPACGARMPLVRSFWLSKRKGRETWLRAVVENATIEFRVVTEGEGPPDGTVERSGARCLVCKAAVSLDHVRREGRAGRIQAQMLAVIGEGDRRRRIFLSPLDVHEAAAQVRQPESAPDQDLPERALGFRVQNYGMTRYADLFTNRQLLAMTTFSDLVPQVAAAVAADARAKGITSPERYGAIVATYLAFAVDKLADWGSSLCGWIPHVEQVRDTFARHALSMTWDFIELNPFSTAVGNFLNHVDWVAHGVEGAVGGVSVVRQADVANEDPIVPQAVVCTDPPYYDNIGYADLSDFFYVWLRRSLISVLPAEFSTVLTPKGDELIANPFRFDGDRRAAEEFFRDGFRRTFARLRDVQPPDFPLAVIYAFKQAESDADGATASTGWETMLGGLMDAGLLVTGTWPLRTERSSRSRGIASNALASSVVLACRPRPTDAPLATRKDFVRALRSELPEALRRLQRGSIAPVDLAQAAIGPGIGVYSRFTKVVEADGSAMSIRAALGLINQALDEILAEQEGDFDPDTRWAVAWFEQFGMSPGPFGDAETLSKAKNTAVAGLVRAGILKSAAGKVQLLARSELDATWDPSSDARLTVWEVVQHMIRIFESGGEVPTASLLRRIGSVADPARELAYRLYAICERKKWAGEAMAYNALVVAWPELSRLAAGATATQSRLEI
jgi:putative DNA methylase